MQFDTDVVAGAIQTCSDTNQAQFLGEYSSGRHPDGNEFLVFLKPELTRLTDTLPIALEIINNAFERFDVRIGAMAVLPSSYLRKHGLIAAHYGAINRSSLLGRDGFGPEAVESFESLVKEWGFRPPVLGAHQFLAQYSEFSPKALAVLYDNLVSTRLAGGTHGALVTIGGRSVLLLNGFHPAQLEHFEADGRSILATVAYSTSSWVDLRTQMTGATDPKKAQVGSIRRLLLERKDEVGLSDVAPLTNGLHVSAGPVEAAVEISRYMSDWDSGEVIDPTNTTIVRMLEGAIDADIIDSLLSDRTVKTPDGLRSGFDATEEVDTSNLVETVSTFSLGH